MKEQEVESTIVTGITGEGEVTESTELETLREEVEKLRKDNANLTESNAEKATQLDALGTRYNKLFALYANNLDFYLSSSDNNN